MVPASAAAHTAHSLLALPSAVVLLLVLLSLSLSFPSFAAAQNGGGGGGGGVSEDINFGMIHADGGRFVSQDGGHTFYVIGANTYYLGKGRLDPMKPTLKAPGYWRSRGWWRQRRHRRHRRRRHRHKRLHINCDVLLSTCVTTSRLLSGRRARELRAALGV
jgi:hypothetical protein